MMPGTDVGTNIWGWATVVLIAAWFGSLLAIFAKFAGSEFGIWLFVLGLGLMFVAWFMTKIRPEMNLIPLLFIILGPGIAGYGLAGWVSLL